MSSGENWECCRCGNVYETEKEAKKCHNTIAEYIGDKE